MTDSEDDRQRLVAMVVDAEPLFHMNLETELEELGYSVTHCRNPPEAQLAIADGARPDLAIIEVIWPDMQGLDLAEWFADNRPEVVVAIVSVSRRALEQCRARLPASHANLPRPDEFDDLVAVARTVRHGAGDRQSGFDGERSTADAHEVGMRR